MFSKASLTVVYHRCRKYNDNTQCFIFRKYFPRHSFIFILKMKTCSARNIYSKQHRVLLSITLSLTVCWNLDILFMDFHVKIIINSFFFLILAAWIMKQSIIKRIHNLFSFSRSVIVVELQEFMECTHWKVYTNAQSLSLLSMQ